MQTAQQQLARQLTRPQPRGANSHSDCRQRKPKRNRPDARQFHCCLRPEIVLNLPANTSGGPESITLSLSNSANGEQLTIGLGSQQGANPDQITLNLSPSANEQIILNLFNSAPSTSSPKQRGQRCSLRAVAMPGARERVFTAPGRSMRPRAPRSWSLLPPLRPPPCG